MRMSAGMATFAVILTVVLLAVAPAAAHSSQQQSSLWVVRLQQRGLKVRTQPDPCHLGLRKIRAGCTRSLLLNVACACQWLECMHACMHDA